MYSGSGRNGLWPPRSNHYPQSHPATGYHRQRDPHDRYSQPDRPRPIHTNARSGPVAAPMTTSVAIVYILDWARVSRDASTLLASVDVVRRDLSDRQGRGTGGT